MDLELLEYLTPAQKSEYAALERLFNMDGWEKVETWAKRLADQALERLEYAKTWEENRVAYGARQAFMLVTQLRAMTEAEFESLAVQAQEASIAKEEVEHE